jgi:hypothetical protein
MGSLVVLSVAFNKVAIEHTDLFQFIWPHALPTTDALKATGYRLTIADTKIARSPLRVAVSFESIPRAGIRRRGLPAVR